MLYVLSCWTGAGYWLQDGGLISDRERLPVTEMTFLQTYGGKANVSLGKLECMGSGKGQFTMHVLAVAPFRNTHFCAVTSECVCII